MNSQDLTREQYEKLSNSLSRGMGFTRKLQSRMKEKGFPEEDALMKLVDSAFNAMHRLSIHLHYARCGMNAGYSYPTYSYDPVLPENPKPTPK